MLEKILIEGIKELSLTIENSSAVDKLIEYINLLIKWNKTFSLTAITDIHNITTHHLFDGLTIIPYLNQLNSNKVLDVGSGMGVPGVIIAIWYPKLNVTLIDSNSKKTSFLKQVAIELNLNNLEVITSKVQDYEVSNKFDVIISRAFANTNLFINLTKHLLKPKGFFMAMKSQNVEKELNEIKEYNYEIIEVKLPNLPDKRVLLKIKNK